MRYDGYNPRKANGARRRKHREQWKRMGLPCAICGQPIDYSLGMVTDPVTGKKRMHPMSFVIDEIVPVARYWEGGYRSAEECAADMSNQRPAHWICNARRGDGTKHRRGARKVRARVHVVCGPPCSGKTTFVRESKSAGDVVVDLDAIAYALGSGTDHGSDGAVLRVAFDARRAAIQSALKCECTVWIIHTQPNAEKMREYAGMGAIIHVLDPGIDECLARAERDRRPKVTTGVIRKWYSSGGVAIAGSQQGKAVEKRAADTSSGTF